METIMKQFLTRYAIPLAMLGMSALVHAQDDDVPGVVPEPGVLGLVAIGAAVAVVVSIARKRRK